MTNEMCITTTCFDCGRVQLDRDQLWLVLTTPPDRAHFDFFCPDCSALVQHHADEETIAALAQLVAVEELVVPAEALEPHDGPALTTDDLIDLMLDLEAQSPTR